MHIDISRSQGAYSSFPLKKYLSVVKKKGGILLHSGKQNAYHRFHLVGYDPLVSYTGEGLILWSDKTYIPLKDKNWLNTLVHNNPITPVGDYPFQGGLLGYFSYEYKSRLEEKGLFKTPQLSIPLCELVLYQSVLVFDTRKKKCLYLRQSLKAGEKVLAGREKVPLPTKLKSPTVKKPARATPKAGKAWFIKSVRQIKRHILNGDVYQANLTRPVTGEFRGDELELARKIFKLNPAPMQGYMHTDQLSLISTSPERFFRKQGSRIESFPIKGTIKRGKSRREDRQLKKKLLGSPKERAELAMIVDLLQNDMARVSQTGTVQVEHFPKIDSYKNVHHLYAVISSQTPKTNVEVFSALFPGGSVTGCPKIKACQILEEIEASPREAYTGCLGYFSFDGQCDFNILIRSITLKNNSYRYQVGGGITFLSHPQGEWEETIAKEQSLAQVFREFSRADA